MRTSIASSNLGKKLGSFEIDPFGCPFLRRPLKKELNSNHLPLLRARHTIPRATLARLHVGSPGRLQGASSMTWVCVGAGGAAWDGGLSQRTSTKGGNVAFKGNQMEKRFGGVPCFETNPSACGVYTRPGRYIYIYYVCIYIYIYIYPHLFLLCKCTRRHGSPGVAKSSRTHNSHRRPTCTHIWID